MTNSLNDGAKIIDLKTTSPIFQKWGDAAQLGFMAVPDVLMKNQSELALTSQEFVVLLNLLMHWWYADQKPFPRSTTISKRMGISARSVQRMIQRMVNRGLLARTKQANGNTSIDPSPLVARLNELALHSPEHQFQTENLQNTV